MVSRVRLNAVLEAAECCCCCQTAGEQLLKPVVSVYPAASRAQEGTTSLLCLASDMFPPEVRFSWKRQKKNGPLEELSSAEVEQLEVRERRRRASILVVHQQEDSSYEYSCSVKHEAGQVDVQTPGNEGWCSAGTQLHVTKSRGHSSPNICVLVCFRASSCSSLLSSAETASRDSSSLRVLPQ